MKKRLLAIILALMLMFTSACSAVAASDKKETENPAVQQTEKAEAEASILKVHFLDVGQADCTLIQLPNGEEVLIDAGNRDDDEYISGYISGLGIDDIEYLVLTHPHEDHIGSAKYILENFEVDNVYMPDAAADSNLYKDTMAAVKNSGAQLFYAKPGTYIIDTKDLKFEILAPKSMYYSELNEYSAVTRLDYMDTSFIFTGDAESVSELEMMGAGFNLNADVLKVGHHGGRTSSSRNFLQAVTPEISVISCGEDNSYGHPHLETLNRLTETGSKIYRTDELGTIVAVSDGQNIDMSSEEGSFLKPASSEASQPPVSISVPAPSITSSETGYVGNRNSLVFHYPDCSSVSTMKETNKVMFGNRQDAVNLGYTPCSRCNP